MRRISFQDWLENLEEVPDVTRLALLIAKSGLAGISRDDLRRLVRISSDTLENLLTALVAAGQVTVLQMNGQRVYRATM
jgi:DNA-binding transcriptional ArsR family regulator